MAEKKVILAVGAHPDDIDFTSSGTVAKFVEEGADAYYVVCTDGSKGSDDPNMTHEQLVKIRENEQRAAGEILGLKDVFFLGHTDTQLMCDLALKEQLVKIIRTIKPDIVITMNPTHVYTVQFAFTESSFVNHTDHRAAAQATMDAVFPLARDRLTFPEHEQSGLKSHRVDELWLVNFDQKEFVVDITKTMEKKLKALAAHASQIPDFKTTQERLLGRASAFAQGEPFEYAESFVRLILP